MDHATSPRQTSDQVFNLPKWRVWMLRRRPRSRPSSSRYSPCSSLLHRLHSSILSPASSSGYATVLCLDPCPARADGCGSSRNFAFASSIMKSYAIGELELPPLADTDSQDEADTGSSLSLPVALRAREVILDKSGWRKVLGWFRQKREQRQGSDDTDDDLSGRDASTVSEKKKKWFRLPIPFPAGLRRRRPSATSSYVSSYQSSVASRNRAQIYGPFGRRKRLLGNADSQQSAPRSTSPQVGEASWVSFCRAIEIPCKHSVRIDLVEYDADRCPSDLISVPMQVSMRDVAVMALMAGMELTSASFSNKSISMQGAVGTLTSSNHAILGPILHSTPRHVENSLPMVFGAHIQNVCGKISGFWIARTWDTCSVAGSFFNSTRRRTVRRLDDRWIRDKKGVESYGLAAYGDPKKSKKKRAKKKEAKEGTDKPGASEGKTSSAQVAIRPRINRNQIPERRAQDGHWIIYSPISSILPPDIVMITSPNRDRIPPRSTGIPKTENPAETEKDSQDASTKEAPTVRQSGDQEDSKGTPKPYGTEDRNPVSTPPPPPGHMGYPVPHRRATVEDDPEEGAAIPVSSSKTADTGISPLIVSVEDDHGNEKGESHNTQPNERAKLAKERQDARAERLRQIQEDKIAVDNVVKRGVMGSPYEEAQGMVSQSKKGAPLLLTNYPHFPEKQLPGESGPTAEEEAAYEREKMREKERRERDQARDDRNRDRNQAVALTKVDMFWLCQVDVMPGTWATPWESHLPISSALDGAVTVILEALLGFLDDGTSLCYTGTRLRSQYSYERTADWMLQGNYTCPAYGQNARGGVIATGTYQGVHIPSFESMIPALELLYSYEWQVDSDEHDRAENGEEQNIELMRLDAWLSYVGRVPEIAEGPHDLLRQTPALVQLLMEDFEIDFQNIDLSAREGGLQDIQGLAENVMDFLTDEELTPPEQLYVLVAFLRGVKAAQCVLDGSDTTDLKDILLKDVQAHLV
ncbi:hypothetical protein F5Y10DRAFT_249052 [Nemania abortiva]|nr:hypothetical protein F5Y10DRAFT_249052 [Nemania abortiva]